MKNSLLILLCLPIISFGQDLRGFRASDIIINQALENTVKYIKDINTPAKEFKFYLNNKKPNINWNEVKFSKWQINYKKIKQEN